MNALIIVKSLVVLIGVIFIGYNKSHFHKYFTWFFKQSLGTELINLIWLLGLGLGVSLGLGTIFLFPKSEPYFGGLLFFVVSTGLLQATLNAYRCSFDEEERFLEKSKKEKLLRIKQEEDEKSKQEIEDRKVSEFQNVLNSLGIIEKVTIAKNAVEIFPLGEYEQIVEHLTNENHKNQVLSELNEKIRTDYENYLLSKIGVTYKSPLHQKRLDEVVNDIMKIGLEMIFKKYGIDGSVHQNYGSASREISKIKNWSDIKGKL